MFEELDSICPFSINFMIAKSAYLVYKWLVANKSIIVAR